MRKLRVDEVSPVLVGAGVDTRTESPKYAALRDSGDQSSKVLGSSVAFAAAPSSTIRG